MPRTIDYRSNACQMCAGSDEPAPYSLGPPENGSLDARDVLRLCLIHYYVWVRLCWVWVGADWWDTERIVSGLTPAGRRAFEVEWGHTRRRILKDLT